MITTPHVCTVCNGDGCGECDSGEVLVSSETRLIQNDGTNRPDPKDVRGNCPDCGEELVSNMYYICGKGYLLVWECWNSLSEKPTCSYQRVL